MQFLLIRKFLTQIWLYLFKEGVGWDGMECLFFHRPVSKLLCDLRIVFLTGVNI